MVPMDEVDVQRVADATIAKMADESTGEFEVRRLTSDDAAKPQKTGAPWWAVFVGAGVALLVFVSTLLITFGSVQAKMDMSIKAGDAREVKIEKLAEKKADLELVRSIATNNSFEHSAINKKLDDILLLLANRPTRSGGSNHGATPDR